jgi:hypothetical protein
MRTWFLVAATLMLAGPAASYEIPGLDFLQKECEKLERAKTVAPEQKADIRQRFETYKVKINEIGNRIDALNAEFDAAANHEAQLMNSDANSQSITAASQKVKEIMERRRVVYDEFDAELNGPNRKYINQRINELMRQENQALNQLKQVERGMGDPYFAGSQSGAAKSTPTCLPLDIPAGAVVAPQGKPVGTPSATASSKPVATTLAQTAKLAKQKPRVQLPKTFRTTSDAPPSPVMPKQK